MPKNARVHLRISELAPGGDGVAHVDHEGARRAVFARRTAVGDEIDAEIDWSTRPAKAHDFTLLTPGETRVDPGCAVWSTCGGCNWLHITPKEQARAHAEIVKHALPSAWGDIPIAAHEAPEITRYRTRARLHAIIEKGKRGRVVLGMFGEKSHDPIETDTCVALHPRLDATRRDLASIFSGARGSGDVSIALGAFPARLPVIAIAWRGELAAGTFAALERGVATQSWQGAHIALEDAARPLVIGDPTPWLMGADETPIALAPAGFAQSSDAGNRELARRVSELAIERLPQGKNTGIVEMYAGAGNLTVLLARHAKVQAVESENAACEAARGNLSRRNLAAKLTCADARTFVWPKETHAVVLDPPRTGAREVSERLVSSPVARIVYLSCDPQTLGRDLEILSARYRPLSVDTFEMFPGTSHVESVVHLERIRG